MAAREAKVAAVVPALNEDQTIGGVIAVLKQSPCIDEVIVISDGSTDKTVEVARAAGADIIHEFPWRHGKGAAVEKGVSLTDAAVVAFFDADLTGLTTEHIEAIVGPVASGRLDMNVGLRDRGWPWTAMAKHLPLIGGERAMKRSVIESIPSEYLKGWKIESALNYYCKANRLQYGSVVLSGIHIRRKISKFGFWLGLREYIHMFTQVAKAMIEVRRAHAAFVRKQTHEKHISA